MKLQHLLPILTCLLYIPSLWSFPVYDIDALLRSSNNKSINNETHYILQGTIPGNRVFRNSIESHKSEYKLMAPWNYPYLRLVDKDNHTMWVTTKLSITGPGEWDVAPLDETKEYPILSLHTRSGFLLRNHETMQYILKQFNGDEIEFPNEFNSYGVYDATYYIPDSLQIIHPYWYFYQLSDTENPMGFAFTDSLGGIFFKKTYRTNTVPRYSPMFISPTAKTILMMAPYDPNHTNFLLLSWTGTTIKEYKNIPFSANTYYNIKAPDYAVLYTTQSKMQIMDLRNGEFIAAIIGQQINITQADSTLYAVVQAGKNIVVMDVLKGKVLQNLNESTNYAFPESNHRLMISNDAKQVWISRDEFTEEPSTLHFIKE